MKASSTTISSTYKIKRYEKIFSTFIKYGFEDILSHPPLSSLWPQSNVLVPTRGGKKVSQYSRYERIRMVCEELGTTFIKFAQIASNRPDLLPEELIHELEKLQDKAPVIPTDEIYKTLSSELLRPLDELVEYFDPTPVACASMAQVHKATLKGGKEVALKIQRPGIRKIIGADISILYNIVSIIDSYFPQYNDYQPRELLKMFEQSINEELNFRMEVNNLMHFQHMFKDDAKIFIPSVYKELCTEKVICMDFVQGYKITDLDQLAAFDITGKELAHRGISLYFDQVFDHGFFHADPHPGNIFVLEDGRIALIDYGMVGSVSEPDKIAFAKILLAIYTKDVKGLKRAILKFSNGLTKDQDREFEYDIIYFLRQYSQISLKDIDGNEIMRALNSLFFDYKIKIPANLLLLLKALIIIEGVGLQLDPNYDIIQNIGPYAQRLINKTYNPQRLKKDLIRTIEETNYLIQDMPSDIREIINKVKAGKLHLEFEHKGLQPFSNALSQSIYNLSFAMIIVALLISSSIIILAKIPPFYQDISLIGVFGIITACVMMVRLYYKYRIRK